MTSDEKKKYRMEQRRLAAGKAPKEEKPKKEKKENSHWLFKIKAKANDNSTLLIPCLIISAE